MRDSRYCPCQVIGLVGVPNRDSQTVWKCSHTRSSREPKNSSSSPLRRVAGSYFTLTSCHHLSRWHRTASSVSFKVAIGLFCSVSLMILLIWPIYSAENQVALHPVTVGGHVIDIRQTSQKPPLRRRICALATVAGIANSR